MRKTLAGMAALGILFAVPAFAQQDQQRQQDQPGAQQTQQDQQDRTTPEARDAEPGQRDADRQARDREPGQQQAQTGRAGQPRAVGPDRLREVLENAGFQDIQIIDAAYLVQAQTEDGDTVFMMINPPAGAGAGMAGGAREPGATGATGADRPGATDGTQQRGTGGTEPNPPQQNR